MVHIPSLSRILAETVDSALERVKDALPPPDYAFITAKQRKYAEELQRTEVDTEKGVPALLQATTGTFCPYVASTLLLHPDAVPEWQTLICYSSDVSSESSYANTVDGELFFRRSSTIEMVERNMNAILE